MSTNVVGTDAQFDGQAMSGSFAPVHLVELNFKQGMIRVTPWGDNIEALGYTFLGVTQCQVGQLRESEDGVSQKTEVTLNGVKESNLGDALGSPDTYQGRPAKIWLCMLDPATGRMAGSPVMRFNGVMDAIGIERGGDNSKINVTLRSGSYNDYTKPSSMRLANLQHQSKYPGDRGLEYVASLITTPPAWLTVLFQKQ